MTDQKVNHWNLTQEPSDMMKSNPPMPVTIAPETSKQIEIINDDSFSYAGYQVVRGEFFAHLYEPSFTFNNYKVSVNTACIKKLPDVEYVQILVNPEQKNWRYVLVGKKKRILFAGVPLENGEALSKSPVEYSLQK